MKKQTKLERAAEKYGNNVYTVPHFQGVAEVHFIEGALWLARQLKTVSKEGATDHRETMLIWLDDAMKGDK